MARCRITNHKTLRRLSAATGRTVVVAWSRGGTDHRVDAGFEDGSIVHVHRDGRIEQSDIRFEPARLKN